MATIYTDPFMWLTIHKRLNNQPTVVWSNTYGFSFGAGAPTGDGRRAKLVEIANQVFRFERAFHLDLVQFTRGVWSTETPEPPQTTPENHFTVPFPTNNRGVRTLTENYVSASLSQVLWVGKEVGSGSEGKLFYRGVLDVNMLNGDSPQKTTLQLGIPSTDELLDDFADARELEVRPYLEPITSEADGVSMVMFYDPQTGPTISRNIYNLYVKGATENKHNKKFFNITPTP